MPPSVKKVEKAMEAMIGEIQKAHLLPKQKEVSDIQIERYKIINTFHILIDHDIHTRYNAGLFVLCKML